MRTLTWLLATALLSTALVPLSALAQPPEGAGAPEDAGASNAKAEEAQARRAAMLEARQEALAAFREARTAALDAYRASLAEIREAYMAAKADVLAECRPLGHAEVAEGEEKGNNSQMSNMSAEEKQAFAHCVQEGLEPLKAEARSAMREAHADARAALRAAAQDAIAQFRAEAARIRGEATA